MIVMQIEGVEGDCALNGYEKWIELTSINEALGVPYDHASENYKTGTVELSDSHGSFKAKGHLIQLMQKMGKAALIPTVVVEQLVTDDGNKPVERRTYTNVTFTSVGIGASSGAGGGGGFNLHSETMKLEIWVIPSPGSTPIAKGGVTFNNKQKTVT